MVEPVSAQDRHSAAARELAAALRAQNKAAATKERRLSQGTEKEPTEGKPTMPDKPAPKLAGLKEWSTLTLPKKTA